MFETMLKTMEFTSFKSNIQCRDLYKRFDLVGGTSTGAIIAHGLKVGLKAKEASEMYTSLSSAVFAKKTGLKYDHHLLESHIKNKFGTYADYTLIRVPSDGIKIFTVASEKDDHSGKYFRFNPLLETEIPLDSHEPKDFEAMRLAVENYFTKEEVKQSARELCELMITGASSLLQQRQQLLSIRITICYTNEHGEEQEEDLMIENVIDTSLEGFVKRINNECPYVKFSATLTDDGRIQYESVALKAKMPSAANSSKLTKKPITTKDLFLEALVKGMQFILE